MSSLFSLLRCSVFVVSEHEFSETMNFLRPVYWKIFCSPLMGNKLNSLRSLGHEPLEEIP